MSDHPNYVPGEGNPDAKLLVCGMAPGAEENEHQHPWIGPAGKLMREMLKIAGVRADDCWLTNIEKYMPPNNQLNRFKELGRKPFQDINVLQNEINSIKPYTILALGDHALKGTTNKKGIKKWRGSIIPCSLVPDTKVLSTYHPSALLRSESSETKAFSYSARAYMQNDFNRAVAQSKFREFRLPQRKLEYATTAEEVERFFYLYREFKKVSIDIETTKGTCVPTCIGFAFTPDHGLSIPLLNISAFKVDDYEQAKMIQLVQSKLLDPDLLLIGQNIKFDLRKLVRPFAFKINAIVHHDIGMCNHVLYPEFPKSLQFMTSTWTDEPYYKDELHEWDPDKQSFADILTYNAKDVCVPMEVYHKQVEELDERGLSDFFYREVMPLSNFYQELEDRGIRFDSEVQRSLRDEYTIRKAELERNIESILGHKLDINSPKKVAQCLFDELNLPKRKNTKEDTLVALLASSCANDITKYSVVSDLLEIRKLNRSISGPLSALPDYDGRMRSNCNINGASNGRTSFNILKPPERPTKLGLQFQNITKHGEIGPEMRRMLLPDHGKILCQLDMSQAEARIVAALAKDEWLMSLFARSKDVHSITASWYFGKEDQDSPEDPIGVSTDERFIGKTTRHALAYFCQWKKLGMTINKLSRKFGLNVTVTAAECKAFRAIFLAKSPKIPEVFWKEVLAAINKNKRTLVAASGRPRTFFGLWDTNLYYSYIPSASVTDHNKFSAVRLKRRIPQLEILKEDHDSITFQCTMNELPEFATIGREEYERPIDLSRCSLPRDPIVIPCDVEIGDNYKDLEKWRAV